MIELGTEKEITFQIQVATTIPSGEVVTKTKDLAISVESYTNTNSIDNTVEHNDKTFNIYIDGISSKVKFIKDSGRILNKNGSFKHGNDYTWKEGAAFDVVSDDISYRFDENNGLKIYEMKYILDGKKGIQSSDSNTTAWAYATWVETTGSLKITISEEEKKCNPNTNPYEGKCQEENIEMNVCHEITGLEKTIYSTSSDFKNYNIRNSEGCTSELTKIIEGTADISYYSTSIPVIENKTIYAGGGFAFSAQYTGTAKYNFVGLRLRVFVLRVMQRLRQWIRRQRHISVQTLPDWR